MKRRCQGPVDAEVSLGEERNEPQWDSTSLMATWELAADKREGSGGPEDAEAGVVLLSSGVRQGQGSVAGH